jgi:hypothetical protein
MSRTCTKCKVAKPVSEFYPNKNGKDGFGTWCKKCNHANSSANAKKMREATLAYLGNQCVQCGFSDSRALHIDHVNGGGNKDRHERSWYMIYREILLGESDEKYQLLCANCNMIKRVVNKEYGIRRTVNL